MNTDTGVVLAGDAHLATSLKSRLLGLIGRTSLPPGYALGIGECDWVHTFGVCLTIDVAYCDKTGRVLRIVDSLAPNRIAPRASGATIAWEIEAGEAGGFRGRVHEGQRLVLQPAITPEPKTERQKV